MRVYQIIVEADLPRRRRSTFPSAVLSVPATNLALVPQSILTCQINPAITAGATLPEFPLETRLYFDAPQPAGGLAITLNSTAVQSAQVNSPATAGFATTPPPLQSLAAQTASTATAGVSLPQKPLSVPVQQVAGQSAAGGQVAVAAIGSQLNLLTEPITAGATTSLNPLAVQAARLTQTITAGYQQSLVPINSIIFLSAPAVGSQTIVAMACLQIQASQLAMPATAGVQLPLTPISNSQALLSITCTGGYSATQLSLQTRLSLANPSVTAAAAIQLPAQYTYTQLIAGLADLFPPTFLNLTPLRVDSTLSLTGQLQPPSPLVCYSIVLQPEFGCEVIIQPQVNLEVEFQEC